MNFWLSRQHLADYSEHHAAYLLLFIVNVLNAADVLKHFCSLQWMFRCVCCPLSRHWDIDGAMEIALPLLTTVNPERIKPITVNVMLITVNVTVYSEPFSDYSEHCFPTVPAFFLCSRITARYNQQIFCASNNAVSHYGVSKYAPDLLITVNEWILAPRWTLTY